jgi:hypothetical protein
MALNTAPTSPATDNYDLNTLNKVEELWAQLTKSVEELQDEGEGWLDYLCCWRLHERYSNPYGLLGEVGEDCRTAEQEYESQEQLAFKTLWLEP